ncbi:MAG TPA: TRAP transporter small permease subunit [Casimicrobiaceae bacterium]|nr:TRAP transporter small permease subunit [Casimicrobiaceae bacterium]
MTSSDERPAPSWRRALDRVLGALVDAFGILALPLSLLLFLQWPLRELVQAYSREANDLAQCLFALYVSVAILCATRLRAHLATDAIAHRYSPALRARLARIGSLAILVPGSAFVLWSAWPIVWNSVAELEAFPETFNPGYFVVKAAVVLLAVLVLVQALADGIGGSPPARH